MWRCLSGVCPAIQKEHPDFAYGFLNGGILRTAQKKFQAALDPLSTAIKSDPKLRQADILRSEVYFRLGLKDLAAADQEKATTMLSRIAAVKL